MTYGNHPMDTIELADGGILFYFRAFLPTEIADRYFIELKAHSHWGPKSESQGNLQHRLTASYGDHGVSHRDSVIPVLPWSPTMLEIKSKIESVHGRYNYCLLNLLRSGPDDMTWRAEKGSAVGNVIGFLSLGATRKFRIRHNVKKNPRNFLLENGTLIVMAGTMQEFWQHEIQKSKENLGERIHLTFKMIGDQ